MIKVLKLFLVGLVAAIVVVAAPVVSLMLLVWGNKEESERMAQMGEIVGVSVLVGDVLLFLAWKVFPPSSVRKLLHPFTFVLLCGVWTLYNIVGGVFWFLVMNAVEGSKTAEIALLVLYAFGHVTLLVDLTVLSRCKMSKPLYCWLVNYPAACWFTTMLIEIPFLAISGFVVPYWRWFPLIVLFVALFLSVVSLFMTIYTPRSADQWVRKVLHWRDVLDEPASQRVLSSSSPQRRPLPSSSTPPASSVATSHEKVLRIIQITDPHLGSFMSVARLRKICEQTVDLDPDIVLLTGDFFTAEAYQPDQQALVQALEPLKALRGKTVACLGNHDKEKAARQLTTDGLESIGAPLLVDETLELETDVGKVQIVGLDFRLRGREQHVLEAIQKNPPSDDSVFRILLIHDPGAFKFVPLSDNSLSFSGHTHGGQIGLHLGPIHISLVGLLGVPDQGLWAHGSKRLYVHRGQGCRSFMGSTVLRVGIPPEFLVLEVVLPSATS